MISESLWRERFGADANIIGRELKLDGNRATVIGVLPQTFRFIYGSYRVVGPLPREVALSGREERSLQVLARVRRTSTMDQARAELEGISKGLAVQYPTSNAGWVIQAEPYRQAVFGDAMRMYPILLAAAGLVLLIVCANISNLLMARTVGRTQELAMRMALGATRMGVLRLVLVEGLAMALAGSVVAMLASIWTRDILVASYPELAAVQVDYRVMLYTLCASVAAGVMFAMGPAISASGVDLNTALKAGGPGRGGQGYRLRSALVITELGLALTLLSGMGLLVRTLAHLRGIDSGLDLRNVLVAEVSLQGNQYSSVERRAQYWREAKDRLSALPGVEAVAGSGRIPLLASPVPQRIEVAGRPSGTGGDHIRMVTSVADAGYLDTVGIRMVAGRGFTSADRSDTPKVAIVNESLAKLLWPNGPISALGQRLRVGENAEWTTVVGVHRDARQLLPALPFPELTIPNTQSASTSMTLLIRTPTSPPPGLADAVQRELRAIDADLPLGEILGLDGILEKFYPRVMAGGLGVFSTVALVLTLIGLYGLISALVQGRTREIGIRIALGADRGRILRVVLWQGLRLVLLGVGLGLAGGFALTRVLSGLLFGIGSIEPLVFVIVASALTMTALSACMVPAWRASRLTPMEALRSE